MLQVGPDVSRGSWDDRTIPSEGSWGFESCKDCGGKADERWKSLIGQDWEQWERRCLSDRDARLHLYYSRLMVSCTDTYSMAGETLILVLNTHFHMLPQESDHGKALDQPRWLWARTVVWPDRWKQTDSLKFEEVSGWPENHCSLCPGETCRLLCYVEIAIMLMILWLLRDGLYRAPCSWKLHVLATKILDHL